MKLYERNFNSKAVSSTRINTNVLSFDNNITDSKCASFIINMSNKYTNVPSVKHRLQFKIHSRYSIKIVLLQL
jgi:hypothetical protein